MRSETAEIPGLISIIYPGYAATQHEGHAHGSHAASIKRSTFAANASSNPTNSTP